MKIVRHFGFPVVQMEEGDDYDPSHVISFAVEHGAYQDQPCGACGRAIHLALTPESTPRWYHESVVRQMFQQILSLKAREREEVTV